MTKRPFIFVFIIYILLKYTVAAETNGTTVSNSTSVTPINTPGNSSSTVNNSSTSGATTTGTSILVTNSTTITKAPFGFSSCGNCNDLSVHDSEGQSYLLMCCDYYTKCCSRAQEIKCPSRLSTIKHTCVRYGPFCRIDDNCSNGKKCCESTTGPRRKCCWSP
ncbi:hypothetical protein CHUAL_008072 [Chamberlinius hualienensis]